MVDGDTIQIDINSRELTVRLIGINAPESVKPNSPVECFGPESSAYAKSVLSGRVVDLEFDESQGRIDQYGRTLAYVWITRSDGSRRLFNAMTVARGYARERQYGPTAYAWKRTIKSAERSAQRAGRGLWRECRDAGRSS